jgi:hypothetical protein
LAVLLAAALGTLSPSRVSAQPARAVVSGVVTNGGGDPQPTVTVSLTSLDSGLERRVVTDVDGSFVIGGLPPGAYQVRVQEDAFVPYTGDVFVIQPGERRTMAIALVAAPAAAAPPVPAPPATTPDYLPTPDRWDLELPVWERYPPDSRGATPFVPGRARDPYNRNILKGDYPVIGQDIFFVLTMVGEIPLEYRRVPTPSGVSTDQPDSDAFFGRPGQFSIAPEALLSFELFKGDTAFAPRAWAFRVTPAFNVNYVNVGERNIVEPTPEAGTTRRRSDVALQEAFGELKLADVGSHYDFISIRAGIQPFNSDFRGFLFRDTNLGVRLFGNWGSNRNQWNVAYFDQLEKDTNSELNLMSRRNQHVVVANYYRQDFLTPGYTISPSFHANLDHGDQPYFDANGFLVRPAPVGVVQPHRVAAYYAGLGGDGHWGRLNVTHQFYQAFGVDDFNGIAAQKVRINAQFAAAEVSVDHDWWRIKGALIAASGDKDPSDGQARGFDAIFDNPNIAGGPFSFWNREGIRLAGTLVDLVGRNSLLPSLRSSKIEGQANFVNPGLLEFDAGWSGDVTPKLRASVNVNLLRFQHTEVLETLLFQQSIDRAIGLDTSAGVEYRPWLNENVVISAGASMFAPAAGFRNILTSQTLVAPFVVLTVRY